MNWQRFIITSLILVFVFQLSCARRELGLKLISESTKIDDTVELDILFVVDNSDSMVEEITAVSNGIQDFIEAVINSNADAQIGVTTMNVKVQSTPNVEDQAGKLQSADGVDDILTTDGDLDQLVLDFQANIDYVLSDPFASGDNVVGKGCEAALEAARLAVDPTIQQNPGFFRATTSQKAIIFITDEDDASIEGIAQPDDNCDFFDDVFEKVYFTQDEYLDFFEQNFGDTVTFHGVITLSGDVQSCANPIADPAEQSVSLRSTINATEGFKASICTEDYAEFLEPLGLSVAAFTSTFPTEFPAIASSIRVYINGDEVDSSGVSYNKSTQSVILSSAAAPGDTVTIEYNVKTDEVDTPLTN